MGFFSNIFKPSHKTDNIKDLDKKLKEWVVYGETKGNIFLYNKVSIKHITEDIIQVWDKYILSGESKEEYIKLSKKMGIDTKGYDKLWFRLCLNEIDCKNMMYRGLHTSEYDYDGKIVNESNDILEWEPIIPNTSMDTLRKKICK